jgi:quinol monooxygenase YgiN
MDEYKVFTSGNWYIKAGREQEFIKQWADFARQPTDDFGKARLLQDHENPQHFLSFGEWKKREAIEQFRQGDDLKQFLNNLKEQGIVERVDVYTLDKVADST